MHTIFVTPHSSKVMLALFSVSVSAHTLLIMDFTIPGEMCKCAMRLFQRVFTQDNQLENGMECWNYAVEHKIITCHLHVMNYYIGSVP